MNDAVRRIADAVLYEGYLLWPYRKSALKNQHRWTFGGVFPAAYSAQRGGGDAAQMQAQCLLEGGADTQLEVAVRFLHIVRRQVLRSEGAGLVEVEELEAGGERHVSWEEATEREFRLGPLALQALRERVVRAEIDVAAGSSRDRVAGGVVRRSWRPLAGTIEVAAQPAAAGVDRVTVRVRNETPWDGADRAHTQLQAFCSSHIVLHARNGEFVSMTDPPARLHDAAAVCHNEGVWPVLAGEPGERATLLCSPMILPDYPQVAPESPGDLFDGGEIDQLLTLSILAMTDDEKRDMRDADPRTRAILERTEALTPEQLMALHGTIRELGLARR